MSIPILSSVDLGLNELQNAKIHLLSADPLNPVPGQLWFNTTNAQLKYHDGTQPQSILNAAASLNVLLKPTATITLNNQTISNLGTPVNASDAATKAYVDSKIPTTATGPGKFTAQIGDGLTTAIVVTHNLNTRAVVVAVYQNVAPFAQVIVSAQATTVNTVTLPFVTAPLLNQYYVVVIG